MCFWRRLFCGLCNGLPNSSDCLFPFVSRRDTVMWLWTAPKHTCIQMQRLGGDKKFLLKYDSNTCVWFHDSSVHKKSPRSSHLCKKMIWFLYLMAYKPSLFNAQGILTEEQQLNYLTHSWKNKEVHTFPKGISPKINLIVRPEFELDYLES